MTASEKLTQLIANKKLTNEQLDNLGDRGIYKVVNLKNYLIDKIVKRQLRINTVSVLTSLVINYEDNEYIVYDESGVRELDFDTLNDALDVD